MSRNCGYGQLTSVDVPEARDQYITDASEESLFTQSVFRPLDLQLTLRPLSFDEASATNRSDVTDRPGSEIFETSGSATSGSSIGKLKSLRARICKKPLPRYLRSSVKRQAADEIEPARIGRGVWRDQLLSDRSLRGMAALMTLFAIIMVIIVVANAKAFRTRANRNSSSVGGEPQSCRVVTQINTALLLLINVCATMVLGMSNTFQQVVTSLCVTDLKHALSEFGDSRVDTNSPFNIRHKKKGKKSAWASWLLLTSTSLPVHFLANSLIGPSYTQELPSVASYDTIAIPQDNEEDLYGYYLRSGKDLGSGEELLYGWSFPCWSAFWTGTPHYARSLEVLSDGYHPFSSSQKQFTANWDRMIVHYAKKCEPYRGNATDTDQDTLESMYQTRKSESRYTEDDCYMTDDFFCTLHDPSQPRCRLNVRMSAAFTLMACLVIKATYMCIFNFLARGKTKQQCLTFGDILVASASHPELRVQGECMVNSTDSFRSSCSHTCHKHCRNPEESETGDEIGHCQKCKKWNSHDKFANMPQPAIATKIKKSLITNLSNTALTQICLMMFCAIVLLGVSLTMVVKIGQEMKAKEWECQDHATRKINSPVPDYCELSQKQLWEKVSGGFGGFNHSREVIFLTHDSLTSEIISFSVSNGAQFIYSLLYLMLIYNVTLISQEYDWGELEHTRRRIRTTLVSGPSFTQNYLLQLPKKVLFPLMAYSILTHWMLGEALQAQEAVWLENRTDRHIEHSRYVITYAAYPLWAATFLVILMMGVCWWAFTYKREGFIPQMFGSIRVLMAATSMLDDFPENGAQWGDLGEGEKFRHAGLTGEMAGKIVPNELYAGVDGHGKDDGRHCSGIKERQ